MMTPLQTASDNARVISRLQKLLNRLPALVYRCRIVGEQQYVLEYASKGSIDLLGLTPESLVEGQVNTIERMTHPADLKRLQQVEHDSIVAHRPWQIIYRVQLPGGHIKWVWDQGEAIYGEDGTPLYLEGLMMDVSEQKFQEIALQEENRQLRLSMENSQGLGPLVGKSEAMRRVYGLILKAAETDASVIIYGETGSGKDMVARAIHNYSGRKGAYVPVNCGAIPENLLESEFFGHTRGAFTGAATAKEGFVAAADGGTLFLDEIGELPINLQVKFLRVLESKSYTPLGSNAQKTSHFRLVAATNRDLAALVREKKTRADFYYRINVLSITLPPLRERKEDIPLLIRAWEERNAIDLALPQAVRVAMSRYDWPGNVRELHNFLDRYATFGSSVTECLGTPEVEIPPVEDGLSLSEALSQVEQAIILKTLEKYRWHRGRTAEALGINLRTLQRRMKALMLGEERGGK